MLVPVVCKLVCATASVAIAAAALAGLEHGCHGGSDPGVIVVNCSEGGACGTVAGYVDFKIHTLNANAIDTSQVRQRRTETAGRGRASI